MKLTNLQKTTMAGVIAAHPKPMSDGDIIKCSGRFCTWETRREEGTSANYLHAAHVTQAIEKVVFS